MSDFIRDPSNHPNVFEIIGLFVVIGIAFFLVHYITSLSFLHLFVFPALYIVEQVQNAIFPLLEASLPKPIGGLISVVSHKRLVLCFSVIWALGRKKVLFSRFLAYGIMPVIHETLH
jgi:hypothetical protein